jgi:hypothetical protein
LPLEESNGGDWKHKKLADESLGWWCAGVSGLLRVSLNFLNSMNGEAVGKKLCKLSSDADSVKR